MRILEIAGFMLIFTLTLSALNAIGIFGSNLNVNVTYNYTNPGQAINQTMPPSMNMTSPAYTGWMSWVQLFYVLSKLPEIFQPAYNLGGYLHSLIPIIPWELCAMLTTVVDILNLIAVIQIIRGITFKWMK
jgi:hypothetical protein